MSGRLLEAGAEGDVALFSVARGIKYLPFYSNVDVTHSVTDPSPYKSMVQTSLGGGLSRCGLNRRI